MYNLTLPNGKTIGWRQLDIGFSVNVAKRSGIQSQSSTSDLFNIIKDIIITDKYVDETFVELGTVEQDYVIIYMLSESDDDKIEVETSCSTCHASTPHVLNLNSILKSISKQMLIENRTEVFTQLDKTISITFDFKQNISRDDKGVESYISSIKIDDANSSRVLISKDDIQKEIYKFSLKTGKLINKIYTSNKYVLHSENHICSNPNCGKTLNTTIDTIGFFLETFF